MCPSITKPFQQLHGFPRAHGPQTGIPARQDERSRWKEREPLTESSAEGKDVQTAEGVCTRHSLLHVYRHRHVDGHDAEDVPADAGASAGL